MLVISNNCAGAHLYNKCNCVYNNPFMWGMVFAPEMMNLIRRFPTINWANIKPDWLNMDVASKHHYQYQPNIFGLRVDDVLTIYYTHYKYDANRLEPYRRGPDVFFARNYEYAFNKYMERTRRFMLVSEPPSFLIVAYERYGWNNYTLNELVSIHTNYKVCIVTNQNVVANSRNMTIITDPLLETKSDPVNIVAEYYNDISKAINLLE